LKDIGEDDRFFELGASSLTIIELQIAIEEASSYYPTAQLMRFDTIKEWIAAYSLRAQDRDGISYRKHPFDVGRTAMATAFI